MYIHIYIYIPSKIQVSKKKGCFSTCKNWTFQSPPKITPPPDPPSEKDHLLGRGGLTQGNSQAFAKEQGLRSDGASNGRTEEAPGFLPRKRNVGNA